MTFHKDLSDAETESPCETYDVCMCCGEPSSGPLVGYDLHLPGSDLYTRALFHRDCAFAMAQRIIIDAWPNRHKGVFMENRR